MFVRLFVPYEGEQYLAEFELEKVKKMFYTAMANDEKEIKVPIKIEGDREEEVPLSVEDFENILRQIDVQKTVIEKNMVIPKKLEGLIIDVTSEVASIECPKLIGREHELNKAWFYLSQASRNNVFFIGEPDVGKSSIAIEMIRQIATGECPKEFKNMRVIEIDPEALLELVEFNDVNIRVKKGNALRKALNKISKFINDNHYDIILYIDESIYMLYEFELMEMFFSLLKDTNIPIITTLLTDEFCDYFLDNPRISKYLNYIEVLEPNLYELKPLIKDYVKELQEAHEIKISDKMLKFAIYTSVLAETPSVNPGRIINILDRAFMEASRVGKKHIDKQCILSCYNTYVKKFKSTLVKEKRKTAYHEAGHYIVLKMSDSLYDQKNACVSILPMMYWSGVTYPYRIEGKKLNYTRKDYISEIAVDLGGRIAEYKFSGEYSDGASSDLDMATITAEYMILRLGLSENAEIKNRSYVSENGHIRDYLISDNKKKAFDTEIQKIIEEGYSLSESIITKYWPLVKKIAEQLLKEEILTGDELDKICNQYMKKQVNKSNNSRNSNNSNNNSK